MAKISFPRCNFVKLIITLNTMNLSAILKSRIFPLAGIAVMTTFYACKKTEQPIPLPEKTSAISTRADMGLDYSNQVFVSLKQNKIVHTSKNASWDLAFETGADHFSVYINGSKNLFVYNTHLQDPAKVNQTMSIPPGQWLVDAPNGNPSQTGIGSWREENGDSKEEVYMIKIGSVNIKYYKIVIRKGDASGYTLAFGAIQDTELQEITIPKDEAYNYSYFNLEEGALAYPEPPRTDWDVVFTRYMHIYYDMDNFPYPVNGVLLNPYQTSVLVADTTLSFEEVAYNPDYTDADFSRDRDFIGFNWKTYNTSTYTVNSHKVYIIRTQEDRQWKWRFLSYEKGNTAFQFELIH